MHRSVRYRSFADALILLVSCALLQSAMAMRARASCGDWLAHAGPSTALGDRTTDEAQRLANALDGAFLASNDQPLPIPCDGPFCRSVPAKPIPTAPPSTVNPSDKLLLPASDNLCQPPRLWSFTGVNNFACTLRGYPVDIEHPPRA
jgi:hypothetical protein